MASKNQNGPNQDRGCKDNDARGFAATTDEQQRESARMGGKAVSEDRDHMAGIGRKGGEASAQSRSGSGEDRSASGRANDDEESGNRGGSER